MLCKDEMRVYLAYRENSISTILKILFFGSTDLQIGRVRASHHFMADFIHPTTKPTSLVLVFGLCRVVGWEHPTTASKRVSARSLLVSINSTLNGGILPPYIFVNFLASLVALCGLKRVDR